MQANHPAIAMMWTPRTLLKKTFKSDTALFVQKLKKARASPFKDTKVATGTSTTKSKREEYEQDEVSYICCSA